MAELRILGPPQLVGSDEQPVEVLARQAKRTALLAYLAAALPRGFHRRDKLVAVFWPELDEPHARNALSQALHVLRGALGDRAIRTRGDDEVGLDPDVVRCDVPAFEAALDAGRLAEAAALYRGDLLDGLFVTGAPEFERWLEGERTRLRQRASEGAWALAEAKAAEGETVEAQRWARRAADLVSADEAVVRRLMAFLHRLGDRAAAIRAYEAFAWRLSHDLDLEPSAETQALAAAIREEAQHLSALRSAESTPTPTAAGRPRSAMSPLEGGMLEVPRAVGTSGRGRRKVRLGITALAVAAALAGGWWGVSRLRSGSSTIRSLVVLPLDNLTGDPAQEYFVDGMHEALIAELSRISALKVTSRTSAMQYKGIRRPPASQIARDLGADGLIEGSVTREAGRVRITVQLIHGRSDRHLWGESYERELRGVLALHQEVATEIARQLRVRLTPEEETRLAAARPVRPEAHDLYLRSRYFKQQESLEGSWDSAFAAIGRSVAIDSGFAPAWAWLATMNALRAFAPGPDSALVARARPAVEKALALDPNLSDAYVSLALVRQLLDWDWKGAEDAFRRALELDANNWEAHYEYSFLLNRLARFDEALAASQRALALEPLSTTTHHGVASVHVFARRYNEAIKLLRRGLHLHPNSPLIQQDYAAVLMFAGRSAEADKALKKYFALCCGMSEAEYERQPSTRLFRNLASGERSRALAIVREMETRYPGTYSAFDLARFYARVGDKDQALRWLERSAETREGFINLSKIHPFLDPLRGEPRFQALLKKVGLD